MILLITKLWSLFIFVPLTEAYYMYFFNISNTSVDFKVKLFDIFRFGSVKRDHVSVLKLNLG